MNLHLVLVRPEYGANVGACARALANMGGHRLILIAPACELDISARQMAAGAQSVLQDCVIYPSWEEFYAREGEGLRIALTRRVGHQRKVFPLEEKMTEIKAEPPRDLYLILGPEADGLNADDLAFVNYACHLPAFGEFSSFNLAQAALLAMYLVRAQLPPAEIPRPLNGGEPDVAQAFYFPDDLIKEWLTAMGFDIGARRASAYLTLRRLFLQNLPTRHELQVLEAILRQNIRKLKASVGFTSKELTDHGGDVARKEI